MRPQLLLSLLLFLVGPSIGAAPLTVVGFNIESGDASDHVISLQLEKSVGVDLWGLADVWDESGWPSRLREGASQGEGAEFGSVLGQTGGDSRLMAVYRQDRLQHLEQQELTDARTSRRKPAPLAVKFRMDGKEDFWFVVVDLDENEDRRRGQSQVLAAWSAGQALPIIAVGTFNFGIEPEGSPDPAMSILLDAGWRWARPVEHVGTKCVAGDRMEDSIFLAGPAVNWGFRAEVMYPQSNYCPDSGRTSNHRPVLANLDSEGETPVITGSMPERQVRPFFPEELDMSLRNEPELANPAAAVQTGSAAGESSEGSGDATGASAEPSREAILRRIEALEAEARELRRELETLPD